MPSGREGGSNVALPPLVPDDGLDPHPNPLLAMERGPADTTPFALEFPSELLRASGAQLCLARPATKAIRKLSPLQITRNYD